MSGSYPAIVIEYLGWPNSMRYSAAAWLTKVVKMRIVFNLLKFSHFKVAGQWMNIAVAQLSLAVLLEHSHAKRLASGRLVAFQWYKQSTYRLVSCSVQLTWLAGLLVMLISLSMPPVKIPRPCNLQAAFSSW